MTRIADNHLAALPRGRHRRVRWLLSALPLGQTAGKLAVVEAVAADRLCDPVADAALEQQERIGEEIKDAEKVAPDADRPGGPGSRRVAVLSLAIGQLLLCHDFSRHPLRTFSTVSENC